MERRGRGNRREGGREGQREGGWSLDLGVRGRFMVSKQYNQQFFLVLIE